MRWWLWGLHRIVPALRVLPSGSVGWPTAARHESLTPVQHVEAARQGLPVVSVNKVQEGRPDIVDEMRSGKIQLVFNTTEGAQAIADSFSLRRTALTHNIPYYTTVAGARAAVQAIGALRRGCLEVAPLQSYL